MNASIQETCILRKHYEVLQKEIALEGPEQLATIARVMKHNIPLTLEKLDRLIELEKLVPKLIKQIHELEGFTHGRAVGD